jgi:protein involved in polysaccharide export with SLBB domain
MLRLVWGWLVIRQPADADDPNYVTKGQMMSEVVLENQGSSDSRRRRSRVGLLLFTAVAVALLCKPLPAQSTGGAASGSGSGGQATATGSDGQAVGQGAGTQGDNAQATAQQGMTVYDSGGNAQATDPTQMSADQIIGILQQEPDLLDSVKAAAAQQAGVDPSTISDDALYDSIRQNPDLRAQVTKDLNKLGYSTNIVSANNRTVNASGAARAAQTRAPLPTQPTPYVEPDEPQVIRQKDPYGNLPSMRDLYAQLPPATERLRRFGSDAFILGTGNANQLPIDIPAGPDYVLGPGDSLIVNMWGGQSNRLDRIIDRQGQISLPEAGTVTINGLTIAQAQSAIQKALSTQFQGEHVEISLGRLRTVRVYVVGDVQRPGAFDVSSLSTPLSALYAAGGPTSRGSLRILRQYRGTQLIREIDLYDFLLKGVRSDVDRLLPGDTLLVPPVGPQVSVAGMVRRPAIYELKGEQSLNQVLDLAGGVLVSASLKQINVERIEAHQSRTMLSLQLTGTTDEATQKIAAFHVQDGDTVRIAAILPYSEQAVYLDGHVFRPGKYPYRDGMTINDLLKSYQDIMPEPADHAEIIRLQAPDFRPETISFNLHDMLMGNNPIPLEPFDLVRVFGRYAIDPPRVSIEGDVLRPGNYPMSQGMTVTGLVRMAGGFKRSAYRDEADLASYVVQDGQKVLLNHSNVAVEKALDGDKNADVPLNPGDVVSIRQLAGWQDIGASVTINGEVEHAGSYGIGKGELLSSVLKRTGGFRESAYPMGAILERVQVRQIGEQARQQMILRIESTPVNINPGVLSADDAKNLQASMQQQRDQILTALRSHPATGRQVIQISSNISKWENTSADIELRAGDTIVIPKRPNFVMVTGQVYNSEAITYMPGKDADWYLKKAGGSTQFGNRRAVFVVRADGSIVGHGGIWSGSSVMNLRMQPGDSIVVPEKIVGGSEIWKNVIGAAQVMSSIAITGAVTGIF